MELLQRLHHWQQNKLKDTDLPRFFRTQYNKSQIYFQQIKRFGISDSMDEYEKRKLGVFNLLNFFQLITGILIPVISMLTILSMPPAAWLIAAAPALVSLAVLFLTQRYQHKTAYLFYFIFYPIFTAVIYINGINLGIELSFILFGILSVFFLQDFGYMVFSIGLSMVSYFVLSIVLKDFSLQLQSINWFAYLVNQVLAISYIFYGLYLIKYENSMYQSSIMDQKEELGFQAELLQQQATELKELNALNNKLFSVISHDLKAPMYALRNFFICAQQQKLPAREVRAMLPDVINDLNYTTGLMENLLNWAKTQMQSNGNGMHPQQLDMDAMITDVINLLRIQADAKKITIERHTDLPTYAWADKDMTHLVFRNLLSNAIKFTPNGGLVIVGTHEHDLFTEVYIQDSGLGISKEAMQKINENNFYTTAGTAHEAGTGLGLMLCKEFLGRNGGHMMIESEPGKGSTFSFTLPQYANEDNIAQTLLNETEKVA